MKVPLQWLAEYVSHDLPPAELARRLTMAGLEVGCFRSYGLPVPEGLRIKQNDPGPVWDREKVITARVVSVEKHPNADKLKLPTVEYGQGRTLKMVTGAPNINIGDTGQKVILGLAGTSFWDGHVSPKKLASLTPKPVRGVPSEGMVMSSFELGIDEEHEGIIVLEDDAPVGVPLADFMGDIVLEIDILPNMARCLSLVGIAREVAAITGAKLTLPDTAAKEDGPPTAGRVQVKIEDAELSPRYAAGLIEGVKIGPAPGWMQRRLTYAGMRPINNIVDITNYVMLEWGQPLHAFDYDRLKARVGGKAPTIIVRPAREGEVLKTLDNVERKLTPDMLVIADEAGAIALAGVMGGAETEVSSATTNILLESASFDMISVRRTMRALDLPSEASMRFSKGVPAASVPLAMGRALELMRQYAGGTVAKGVVDVYPAPQAQRLIDLSMDEVRRILGMDISIDECERILRTLEFTVTRVGPDGLRAGIPPHRLDIQEGPADLIEDLVRLHGYDKLPATMLSTQLPAQENNDELAFEEKVRDKLVGAGLQEAITYALTTPEREAPLGLPAGEYVKLLNPISDERAVMRRSVLAGVLEALAENLKHTNDVRLFEIGSVYLSRQGEKLPEEPRRLALALCGRRHAEFWGEPDRAVVPLDFFDLKGLLEGLLADLHIPAAAWRQAAVAALHPGRSAEVVAGEKVLGWMGELHPKVAQAYKLGDRRVLAAELDVEALRRSVPVRFAYRPVPQAPAVFQDIALVVEDAVPAERVEAEIRAAGGALLRDVRLFDLYKGENIPAGHKSLAYALTYQADDRTLTDAEVAKVHKSIEGRLRHMLKAQIRGRE